MTPTLAKPTKCGFWVQLDQASPFIAVFADREAPVTHYLPRPAQFEGDACASGWYLDWERCSDNQREQLIGIYVRKSGLTVNEVAAEIRRTGIGIRVTSVVIAKDYDTGRTLMA